MSYRALIAVVLSTRTVGRQLKRAMRQAPFALVMFLTLASPSFASQQEAGTASLRVNSRAVLVDVVVTDDRGNPVSGLSESAFHVFDNRKPQTINSFEVHTDASRHDSERLVPRRPQGSNATAPAAQVRDVLLIDTSRMNLILQMTLYKQLLRFVRNMPPDVSTAVFLRAYDYPVMLQDFTADHTLLEAAIGKAIPHLQKFGASIAPSFWEANDYLGPLRVAYQLIQVPGRKNLLWFLGGTSFTQSVALANAGDSADPGAQNEDMRRTYDVVQTARMSIYPIDVRGLQPDADLPEQHLRETEFAEETGGNAFYNSNDVAAAAGHALEIGNNFYTLAYSPSDLRGDGSWHGVHLTVDGGQYHLSYRLGYYDDASSGAGPAEADRKAMIKVRNPGIAEPDTSSRPLIFRAQPVSAPSSKSHPKRGKRTWRVHYDVLAAELQHGFANGTSTAEVGAAVVAFNQEGQVVGQVSQKVTLTFEEAVYKADPRSALSFDQLIDLPAKGQIFLYIAVWDATTGRMGTIDLPLDVREDRAN